MVLFYTVPYCTLLQIYCIHLTSTLICWLGFIMETITKLSISNLCKQSTETFLCPLDDLSSKLIKVNKYSYTWWFWIKRTYPRKGAEKYLLATLQYNHSPYWLLLTCPCFQLQVFESHLPWPDSLQFCILFRLKYLKQEQQRVLPGPFQLLRSILLVTEPPLTMRTPL